MDAGTWSPYTETYGVLPVCRETGRLTATDTGSSSRPGVGLGLKKNPGVSLPSTMDVGRLWEAVGAGCQARLWWHRFMHRRWWRSSEPGVLAPEWALGGDGVGSPLDPATL